MTGYGKRQNLIDVFMDYNSKINLSAIRDAQGIYDKHIRDSIELLSFLDIEDGKTIADLGTGGGFPLLPLATLLPDHTFVGIDARQKKTKVVKAMADELGLTNVSTVWTRAEEHKQQYDYVTARAVGYADKVMPWMFKLVKRNGYLILYKGLDDTEESVIFDYVHKYKLTLEHMHHYKIFEEDIQRVIYVFKK